MPAAAFPQPARPSSRGSRLPSAKAAVMVRNSFESPPEYIAAEVEEVEAEATLPQFVHLLDLFLVA